MNNKFESTNHFMEFWKDKELYYNATLITQSYAIYCGGYKDINKKISGLLYLMTDGIHFEDFPQKKLLFNKNKEHNKTEIFIKKENIIKITNLKNLSYNEKKEKQNKNFITNTFSIFFNKDRFVKIHYNQSITDNTITNSIIFETLLKYNIWEEKFREMSNSVESK